MMTSGLSDRVRDIGMSARYLAALAVFVLSFVSGGLLVRARGGETLSSRAGADEEGRSFDAQIAPLLARHCLDCHNPSLRKGGLDLTRADSARAGGDNARAVVPGKPDESLLIERVFDDAMPPKKPIPLHEKEQLRAWVENGAKWGTSPINRFRFTTATRAGYDWWSLRPLSQPETPAAKDDPWPRGDIDRFVLAGLEANGLRPAEPADRRTLIRRLTFDLIGLPPTPEEVDAFVDDRSPDAYEALVNRLLDSPHFGERWARHWLDVVRFAESQGFERNKFRPNAWRYRDWVIEAFNDDLPYDEFVRLQLAGDVLRPDQPSALIATGYLVAGPHDLLGLTQGTEAMKAMTREDEREEMVGNLGQTFLGLTIHCARCHDHKFDPLSQKEFFRISALLGGVSHGDRALPSTADAAVVNTRRQELSRDMEAAAAAIRGLVGPAGDQLLTEVRARVIKEGERIESRVTEIVADAEKKLHEAEAKVTQSGGLNDAAVKNARQTLTDRRNELERSRALLAEASDPRSSIGFDGVLTRLPDGVRPDVRRRILELSVREMHDRALAGGEAHACVPVRPGTFQVLARGDFRQPGEVVTPGGIAAVSGVSSEFGLEPDSSDDRRRTKLAGWITDLRNPLTARVIANRLWHYHFGTGLVETPNDFGFNGGRPSHPELLDWLAAMLIREGWSLKSLHRRIVTSATYRQAAIIDAEAARKDAENRLLWRKSPRRLDAEAIRDAVLDVSGELNPRIGGPGFLDVEFDNTTDNTTYSFVDRSGPSFDRRTVYRTWTRLGTNPLLDALDCADPTVATPRRSVTTTPLQALSLLNNAFMARASEAFAGRLRREAGNDPDRQVERAFRLAYSRGPTPEEGASARRFSERHGLAELCLAILNSNEFLFVD